VNVWWVIFPAQTRIIGWMRSGETPAEMPPFGGPRGEGLQDQHLPFRAVDFFDGVRESFADHKRLDRHGNVYHRIRSCGASLHDRFEDIRPVMTMGRSAPSIRFISAALIAAVCMPPASAWAGSSSAKTFVSAALRRCHGDQGTGDGPAHTMQRPWPRDFTNGSYKFKSTPGDSLPLLSDVERVVAHGIPRTSMSGYAKWLSAEEIRMVSEYVLNFSKKSGAPEKSRSAGSGSRGADEKISRSQTRENRQWQSGVCGPLRVLPRSRRPGIGRVGGTA
jgi:hypothetical protein